MVREVKIWLCRTRRTSTFVAAGGQGLALQKAMVSVAGTSIFQSSQSNLNLR